MERNLERITKKDRVLKENSVENMSGRHKETATTKTETIGRFVSVWVTKRGIKFVCRKVCGFRSKIRKNNVIGDVVEKKSRTTHKEIL